MDQPEAQPEVDRIPTYFDPEAPAMSEQEFPASLENAVDQPRFVLDESNLDGPDLSGSDNDLLATKQAEDTFDPTTARCEHNQDQSTAPATRSPAGGPA